MLIENTKVVLRTPSPLLVTVSLALAAVATIYRYLMDQELSLVVFFMISLFIGLFITLFLMDKDAENRNYLIKLFVFTYSLNVIFTYIFAAYFESQSGNPFIPAIGYRHPDDLKFFDVGVALAKNWHGEARGLLVDPLLGFKYHGYPYIVGSIYYITDFLGDMSPLTPRIVNCSFGALVPILMFQIGSIVYEKRVAYLSVILFIFFPLWYHFSTVILRDVLVAFLLCLYVYDLLVLTNISRFDVKAWLGMAISVFALYFLRAPLVAVLFVGTIGCLLFYYRTIAIRAALLFILFVVFSVALMKGVLIGEKVATTVIDQSERWGEGIVNVASEDSLAVKYIYSAPTLLFVPLITIYAIVTPVPPIQSFMLHHIAIGIAAILWYFYIPFWIYALKQSLKNRKEVFLTIFIVLLFAGIAAIQPTIRHKTQFLGLALIQVASGLILLEAKKIQIIISVLVVLMFLFGTYVALKFS